MIASKKLPNQVLCMYSQPAPTSIPHCQLSCLPEEETSGKHFKHFPPHPPPKLLIPSPKTSQAHRSYSSNPSPPSPSSHTTHNHGPTTISSAILIPHPLAQLTPVHPQLPSPSHEIPEPKPPDPNPLAITITPPLKQIPPLTCKRKTSHNSFQVKKSKHALCTHEFQEAFSQLHIFPSSPPITPDLVVLPTEDAVITEERVSLVRRKVVHINRTTRRLGSLK